ncbi:MAG: hypothetical protein U0531_21660 [Dehalococcoidia bacterium]
MERRPQPSQHKEIAHISYVNETFLRLMARVESLKHRDEEEGAALAEYGLLIA